MSHNFKILNGDTDSITVFKENKEPFSEDERKTLLKELNSVCPKGLVWEDDGYYKTVIVLKAKNYILWDGTDLIIKGSSIRDPKREPALREFINEVIQSMIHEKNDYVEIYNRYVKEIMNVKDIHRWKSKKTITSKVLNAQRTNEQRILDAIKGAEVSEGDKIYVYYKTDGSLNLVENFDGDFNTIKYLTKLHKTAIMFSEVLNKDLFLNYGLKRNEKFLNAL